MDAFVFGDWTQTDSLNLAASNQPSAVSLKQRFKVRRSKFKVRPSGKSNLAGGGAR
jgi:hypothetical protein